MSAPKVAGMLDKTDRTIIEFLCGGLTNRQIARRIGLAEGTVNNRILYACRRTGAKTRIHLVAKYALGEIE